MLLEAKGIRRRFANLQVLKGIDLSLAEAEVVSIVGKSGAGKTTLLNVLSTLDEPDHGKVMFQGKELSSLKTNERAKFRNANIGIVFQFHNLLPEFTALENICIPGLIAKRPKAEVKDRAHMLLNMLGLQHRSDHKPGELSGGEQQRVSVARSLINSPKLIFADEPSGNLDTQNADELHNIFFDLREKMGVTFFIVTHNRELAAMCDRTVTLQDGLVIEDKRNR